MRSRGILAAAFILSLSPVLAASSGTGTISGRAIDRLTGDPVADVEVLLEPGRKTETTDLEGVFVFHVEPGEYRLQAVHVGFHAEIIEAITVPPNGAIGMELALDRHTMTERVVVRPVEAPLEPAPFPNVITAEQAARLPGTFDDPLRALMALPGVSSVNSLKAEVRLRGGEAEDTLFRMDGVTMENPYHFRGAKGSTAALNLDAFDEYQVKMSGIGAEVGNTVSGAIELLPTEQGEGGVFGTAAVSTLSTRITTGGPAMNGGSWLVAGRYSSLDLYRGFGVPDNIRVPDFADLYLRMRQPVSRNVDIVVGSLGFGSTTEQFDEDGLLETALQSQTFLGYVGFDAALSEKMSLTGRLARSAYDQSADGLEGDPLVAAEQRSSLFVQVNGSASGGTLWQAGIEGTQIDGLIEGSIQTEDDFPPFAARTERAGAFASVTFQPSERWRLETGIRADHDTRVGSAPVQPRITATYMAPTNWQVRLSAGRYAQFPRFEQEFLARGVDLGQPVADEVAAGVSFQMFGQFNASATVFARFLTDINAEAINKFPDLGETVTRFDSGRTEGLEFSLSRSRGRVQTWVAFTALSSTATVNGAEFLRNGDQPYRLDFSTVYLIDDHWELLGRFQAAAGLPYTALLPVGGGLLVPTSLNEARLPSVARLDLRASWQRHGNLFDTRIYVELNNVLHRRNVRSQEVKWDDEEEEYYTVVGELLPFIPAFGVQVSWR